MAINLDFTASNGTALTAYDSNFTKAQGAANITAATIESNALQFNSWQNLVLAYTGETTDDAELELVGGIAQTKVGPAIRVTATNYYFACFETDDGTNYTSLALFENTTRIDSFAGSWPIALPQKIRITGAVNGADYDLSVYVNGSETASITFTDNTPLPAGEDGIVFDDASAAIAHVDDFVTGGGAPAQGGTTIDFTAANGTALTAYDANFTKASGDAAITVATIENNSLQVNSWSSLTLAYAGQTSGDVQVTLDGSVAQTKTGPAIQVNAASEYYAAFETDNGTNYTSLALFRNGVREASLAGSWPVASAPTLRIIGTVNGPNYDIDIHVDGTSLLTFTDTAPIANGNDGLAFHDLSTNIALVDNFVMGGPANQAPVAADDTFTIFDNVSNGDTVGTYTATDSDGTIASYAITGTQLAISNAGLITIADNTGITAGTPIIETVTATDDGGATDSATITVNVNAIYTVPSGWSDSPLSSLPNEANTDSIFELSKTDATVGNYTAIVGDVLLLEDAAGVTVQPDTTIIVDAGTIPEGQSLTLGYQWYDSTNDTLTPQSTVIINNLGILVGSDTTPPVITLVGNATVNVIQGNTYTDAGATASDDTDGNITGDIVVGGDTVDTNTIGAYTITYNVSDAAGNAATQVTRTVNVTAAPDTTAPVITLVGSPSVNIVEGNTYTDAGATATDNVDGDITGDIVTVNPVDTNTVGSYIVTYNVSDTAGNSAAQVIRTVNVTPAVVYSYTNTGNLVVDAQSANVTATIPKAEIWTAAPEESGTLLDSVDNLSITNGQFTLSSNQVAPATTYLVILRSTGNTPTQYARAEVQFS